jgi:hypothetical protein
LLNRFIEKSSISHDFSMGLFLPQTLAFDTIQAFLLDCFLFRLICRFWLDFSFDLLLFDINFSKAVLNGVHMMLFDRNLYSLFADLSGFIIFVVIEVFGLFPLFLDFLWRVNC